MIEFGVLSISLLVGTAQGLVLALMLWRVVTNRAANRWLALLIVAVAALITPYIIGFAGFYDRWPWLSFTPLSYTLAFGPLLWLYAATLCGRPPSRFRPSCPMASRRRSSGCASPSLMPSWMKARRG